MSNLLKDNKRLITEWDYEKNKDIDINKITLGSNKKVCWKCSNCNYEWESQISDRTRGRGCPICANLMRTKSRNEKYIKLKGSLADNNLKLSEEWNYEKNGDLKPNMVMANSGKKVWWKCTKGHEWEAKVDCRNKGTNCPYCANKQVLKGYNDLMTINSKISKEWNYERNRDLKPDMVVANSHKKIWWKCTKGHEWEASIKSRNKGAGCPYCSGRQAIIGYNDLATINQYLAKEWNYEKNGDLKPNTIKANSVKKVWWKCSKGHEWEATISSRNRGNGCPICAKELQTSFPEQAIYYYIKQLFPDAINRDHHLEMELDIFIPSKMIAIEYDGIYWHKNSKRDARKNQLCKDNKIILFRVKEDYKECNLDDKYLKIIPCTYSDNGIKSAIEIIASYLNEYIDVNLDRDRILIYTSYINNEKKHSLMTLNPTLAKEWNYEKNNDLQPDMIALNSGKKVWWKCDKGHEWKASLYSRSNGSGCPICANQQILSGYNDLTTISPELTKEWNYEKNGSLKPNMVTANTNKKVWWKCTRGHEWETSISNRNQGKGCPICGNKQVLKGYNDLATINPTLAKEWNYEKNHPLTPMDLTEGSSKKVWWKCNKGHEWQACISNRSNGSGCPICINKEVLKGYNDLATINPMLAKEWNDKKNYPLTPNDVTIGSNKKVWWKCNKGHEWESSISNRNQGKGCPICVNKQVLSGYNDLATINPELAKEWNYEKNGSLKPNMVTANTNKKVWWKCTKGHEWESSISNRNQGKGCLICKLKK